MQRTTLGTHHKVEGVTDAEWYSYLNGAYIALNSVRRVSETIWCARTNTPEIIYGTAEELLEVISALPVPTPLPYPPSERTMPANLSPEMAKHSDNATQIALLNDFDIDTAFDDLL